MLEAYVLFGAIVASLILTQLNQRLASPVLAIFNRWLRWLVFSLGAASVCTQFELIDRPFWVLLVGFVLIYFLIETGYRWLEIHALSVSPMPLFPRFAVNSSGEEWPTHPRLLTLREWLRQQGFRPLQSLKAEVGPGIYLRTSVYQDATGNLRVQITFLPQPGGGITVCHTFSSQTTEGDRIVTDNLFLPFGGFYPENWFVERHPWTRSAARLRHATSSGCAPSKHRWLRGTSNLLAISISSNARSSGSIPSSVFSCRTRNVRKMGRSPTRVATGSGRKSGCSTTSASRRATDVASSAEALPSLSNHASVRAWIGCGHS
jgi:hypothetical protein